MSSLILLYTLIKLKYQVIDKFGEKHPIILIIPIRDREKHLQELLNNLVPILEDDNIDYRIFIIEQNHKNKIIINKTKYVFSSKLYNNIIYI